MRVQLDSYQDSGRPSRWDLHRQAPVRYPSSSPPAWASGTAHLGRCRGRLYDRGLRRAIAEGAVCRTQQQTAKGLTCCGRRRESNRPRLPPAPTWEPMELQLCWLGPRRPSRPDVAKAGLRLPNTDFNDFPHYHAKADDGTVAARRTLWVGSRSQRPLPVLIIGAEIRPVAAANNWDLLVRFGRPFTARPLPAEPPAVIDYQARTAAPLRLGMWASLQRWRPWEAFLWIRGASTEKGAGTTCRLSFARSSAGTRQPRDSVSIPVGEKLKPATLCRLGHLCPVSLKCGSGDAATARHCWRG